MCCGSKKGEKNARSFFQQANKTAGQWYLFSAIILKQPFYEKGRKRTEWVQLGEKVFEGVVIIA